MFKGGLILEGVLNLLSCSIFFLQNHLILLWWGYRFRFMLIFWILRVHGIGAFMPNSSVFIFLMLRAPYGSITQRLWFFNELWTIFRWLLQVIKRNEPSKKYWGHWGCWGCWGHWGHLGSWCQGNHLISKV